ncbi:ABC transporter ATP-binding protein [Alphaproteobacteria bacterium]|jgi:branched-chain amino acid transport system ATP-binding protein|nr:ABC transporter ATP-binding protein [Pseudomonadota bacterium]MDB2683900.1 ABC transporter ATP-binding protein [Alphaproteobacteria bacterium]
MDELNELIRMNNVHAAYHGDIYILNGVSLSIKRNKITGIIGPNGAGKSTVLKTLYGFLKPTQGDILFEGENIVGAQPWNMVTRGAAYVPQNRSLFNDLSVDDNLRLGCWHFRRDNLRVKQALEKTYDMFPILAEKRSDLAGSMSGGQQRFLEIGRALVLSPKLILLDEPTAMIAPKVSQELYQFIRSLPEMDVTVVLVDQNVRQCVEVSDYTYVLELGKNTIEGSREQFGDDNSMRAMIKDWLDYQID